MGAYVYALRGSPASTVKIYDPKVGGGKSVSAGRVSYLYKPSWSDDTHGDSLSARAEATIDRWWGDERPSYAIVTDGPAKAGDTVLAWMLPDRNFVQDDPNWEGLSLGVLVPQNLTDPPPDTPAANGVKFWIGSWDNYTEWLREKTLKGADFDTVWGWNADALNEMKVHADGSRFCDLSNRPAQDLGETEDWIEALRETLRNLDKEADPKGEWFARVMED